MAVARGSMRPQPIVLPAASSAKHNGAPLIRALPSTTMTDQITAAPGSDDTADAASFDRTRIRSFVKRAGRTTSGQARALETLGPSLLVPFQAAPIDWREIFG